MLYPVQSLVREVAVCVGVSRLFAVAYDHHVGEIRQGLGVDVGNRASDQHDRIKARPVFREHRHAGEFQDADQVGIVVFEGDGEGHDVARTERQP